MHLLILIRTELHLGAEGLDQEPGGDQQEVGAVWEEMKQVIGIARIGVLN